MRTASSGGNRPAGDHAPHIEHEAPHRRRDGKQGREGWQAVATPLPGRAPAYARGTLPVAAASDGSRSRPEHRGLRHRHRTSRQRPGRGNRCQARQGKAALPATASCSRAIALSSCVAGRRRDRASPVSRAGAVSPWRTGLRRGAAGGSSERTGAATARQASRAKSRDRHVSSRSPFPVGCPATSGPCTSERIE